MTIIGIILTCILGASILHIISNKFDILQIIGFSFPIGIGVQTFTMFFLNLLGINYSINLILILSISIIVLSAIKFIIKRNSSQEITKDKEKLFGLHKIASYNLVWLGCFAFVLYIVYAISTKSLFWPTLTSDSLSSFDVLAKGLAREGKIINSIILEKRVGYGAAYPPLYSLALAYSYMLGFELSKIIPVLFFISFTISFYALIKKLTNPTNAIFFTLAAIATPELLAQSAFNITSVPQAIYAALGVISIIIWHKIKDYKYFYLSAILTSFSLFTRSEGIVYLFPILLFLVFHSIRTRQYKKTLLYLFIAITPFILWQFFLITNSEIMEQYVQVEIIKYPNLDFDQISKILELATANITNTQYFGLTFYLFVVMIFLNGFNIIQKKDNLWLLSIIFLTFFGYLALINQFILKEDTLDNIINYSGKRFFFGLIFLMWFYIANNALVKSVFNSLEGWLSFRKIKHKIK